MKQISRETYLKQLIDRRENGMIKVVTGIRRCGKSYLLDPLFTSYLLASGVPIDHIIKISLDDRANSKYLNPDMLSDFIKNKIIDQSMYYVILDEIQLVPEFESVLNGFLYIRNLDVYVTGSNSKFLSSDIITEFRGRGDEIRVYPLSFSEYYEGVTTLSKEEALKEYFNYGGMPQVLSYSSHEDKSKYLKSLFELTYIKDIVERNNVLRKDVLESLINVLSSSVGSLTNPTKISNTFKSKGSEGVSINTIIQFIDYLQDSFLIENVSRYDIKGKKYIQNTTKYYFADVGLRNARLNFRQTEVNHLMENIIFLELRKRGLDVDVGIVEIRDQQNRKRLEIDFVVNKADKRYYIQSAYTIDNEEKNNQEMLPFRNVNDSFKKIMIVRDDYASTYYDEEGILHMSLINFLSNSNSLDE